MSSTHAFTLTSWRFAAGAFAATALLCLSTGAMAALGGAPQVRPADASASAPALAQVPAARQLRAVPLNVAYTVSSVTEPTGTVVQEFVNVQQQVFAVVWKGPLLPDLAAYFGDHFTAYQQAVEQKRTAGLRGGVVQSRTADLVIVSRGRMGNFEGYAYLPTLIPQGVDIHTLLP